MQSFVTYLEKTIPQRQQRKFIDEVAHNIPDIIYVLDLKERKIIFINDRVSTILGYAPEEIYKLGTKFFIKKLHPDDYLNRMQHITACQDMKENEIMTIDVRLPVSGESWRWFRIRDIPFKFSNGKVSHTIGVARDIHELKLAKDEIQKKGALLSATINVIPDPLYAFKAIRNSKNEIEDFEWLLLNEAATVLAGDAIGKRLLKQYPGVRSSGLFDIYKQVVETGKPSTTEVFYDYDNIKRWAKLFIAKINDGFVVLSSDIAEKNRMEEEVKKLSGIERISKIITHEIRNPLTNIRLSAQLLKKELKANPSEAEKLSGFAEVISRNCDNIEHLLKELLYHSSSVDDDFVTLELAEIIDQAFVIASDRILLKRIEVKKNIGRGCFIKGDNEKIKIVLSNIIINAIEAVKDEQGKLEISLSKQNEKIKLSISDNGCGMSSEEVTKIFEPFYSTKLEGLGVGLANVKSILDEYGATFHVASEPNKGTVFTIYFNRPINL